MVENDWKKRLGVVFSTNPDFQYQQQEQEEVPTLEPSRQNLLVTIDRRNRGGKQVTLVSGFKGGEEDLKELARTLKVRLGVGGSSSDGQIAVQGDWRDKVTDLLHNLGYTSTKRWN